MSAASEGTNFYPVIQELNAGDRLIYPQFLQAEARDRQLHRASSCRRIGPFEFYASALSADFHQQVKFRPTMDGIKPRLFCLLGLDDFFYGKAFPQRAMFGIFQ